MGFALTLLYTLMTLLTPKEVFPAFAEYRPAIVLMLVTLLASVFTMLGQRYSFKARQLYLVLALTAYAAASVLVALKWFGGAFDAFLEQMFLTGIVLIVSWNIFSLTRLRIYIYLLVAVGIINTFEGVAAIESGYRVEEFTYKEGVDVDPATGEYRGFNQRIRGLGFLNDPNDFGQFLVMDIALLGCCWKKRRLVRNLLGVILPGLLLLGGVYLTRSRGAILALLVLVLLLMKKRLGKLAYFVAGGAGGVAMVAMAALTGRGMTSTDGSAAGRIDSWYAGFQMVKSSPIFGVGYNHFTDHNTLTAHNSYMLCLAELGFPGFLIWLAILVTSLLEMNSLETAAEEAPDRPDIQEIGSAARSMFAAVMMFAITAWFLSRSYSGIFFILIGAVIAMGEIARKAGAVELVKPQISWRLATLGTAFATLAGIYAIIRMRSIF
jgi:putative inorganic carbon (hco3(-)) transporter